MVENFAQGQAHYTNSISSQVPIKLEVNPFLHFHKIYFCISQINVGPLPRECVNALVALLKGKEQAHFDINFNNEQGSVTEGNFIPSLFPTNSTVPTAGSIYLSSSNTVTFPFTPQFVLPKYFNGIIDQLIFTPAALHGAFEYKAFLAVISTTTPII